MAVRHVLQSSCLGNMASKAIVIGLTALMYYCLYTYGAITKESISDFEIGVLFASYDLESVCISPVHFVMAKRRNTGACRWKIAPNFAKQPVANSTGLPVADINRDCLFSCNYRFEEPKMTAELQMLPYFLQNSSLNTPDFDFYTYLALCERTIRGNVSEADFEKVNSTLKNFAGVYYSSGNDNCKGSGEEVLNDKILHRKSTTGLLAARKNTEVNVDVVKEVIKGNREESTLKGADQKAYDAYFRQYPIKDSRSKRDLIDKLQ